MSGVYYRKYAKKSEILMISDFFGKSAGADLP